MPFAIPSSSRRTLLVAWAGSLLLVMLVAAIDYVTGASISVSVFYLAPVVLSTWFAGRAAGLAIACISALASAEADLLTGLAVNDSFVLVWNSLMIGSSFAVVAVLLAALKHRHEHLESMVAQRTKNLREEVAERRLAEQRLVQANSELAAAREELQRSLVSLQQSHAELKSTQLQLIEAAKMESVGRLAAGVAHEVKNPLMTLGLGADYFLHRPGASDEESALLKDMKEAVQRASNIINILLDFARPRPLRRTSEDINSIIELALGLVRHQLSRQNVTVVRQLQMGLPPLLLDRNRIDHVFVNLFVNAIQAMPEGGTLTVRTSTDVARSDGDSIPAGVTVEIEDTGQGIAPEIIGQIFDPFFTTKAPGQGTGLGLSIVRKIVEFHGGSITLGNRSGGGARATLTFNVRKEAHHEQETHSGG